MYEGKLLESKACFPIQILLPFLTFKLPPNFIFQSYKLQTRQLYLFCRALSIPGAMYYV